MKVTLKDIARECAVSVGAVSDILKEKGNFKEETRARVLETVRRLHYRGAGQLPENPARTKTIGLVIPSADAESNPFFSRGIAGIQGAASDHGHAVTLFAEDEIISILENKKGAVLPGSLIIFAPFKDWDPYLPELKKRGVRVALAFRETGVSGIASVTADKHQGILLGLEHLYSLGHSRIGLIRRVPREDNGVSVHAYRDFIQAHELTFDENLIADVMKHDRESFRAWLDALLTADDPPTAFLCEADDLAAGMINILRERQRTVPGDMAVVGFDDSLLARQYAPGITSVHNPVRAICRLAVELVCSDRETGLEEAFPVTRSTVRYCLACSLTVRESCGAKTDTRGRVL